MHIGDDVPNGRYEVRALGPAGLSNPRLFAVSRLAEKSFDSSKNSREQPFLLGVGELVNAVARSDKRDYYRFSAHQGQSLLVQVTADRIDSRFDAALVIYDAASGRRLGRSVQGTTRDPVMTFVAPDDGDYLIEVWDRTFRGGEDYFYRLEVSERAQVEAIFPPVARHGVEQEFSVYGFNLPAGRPITSVPHKEGLQALEVKFVPDFSTGHPFSAGLANGIVAGASLDAASLQLPIPLSGADKVFLERTEYEVAIDRGDNDDRASAQTIDAPGVVAGQFFPRRDVDWYQFTAQQNQTVWVELASQQLGTSSDPAIQIIKKTAADGTAKYTAVATADDLEGPAASRESRRMYSGSGDCTVQFRADANTTYLIGVRDQYNVSSDDPRLIYRLRVEHRQPDFQLIAFAEPERHADEKIAKPNGVSLVPGGSAVIRVRMLPRHGFNKPVHVQVENLPQGVTAQPLTLNSRLKEGFLVLTASDRARPDVQAVKISGRADAENPLMHTARAATARRTANNLDRDLTHGRLCQDLLVAVVDSTRPAAALQVPSSEVETSIGGSIQLPVQLHRKKEFSAEVELVGLQVPSGIKVNKVETKGNHAELNVQLSDANLPPGRYTFPVAAKVKEKRPKNTVVVNEANADLQKIVTLLEERAKMVEAEGNKFHKLEQSSLQLPEKLAAAEAQAAGPKKQLAEKLEEQRQVAASLAEKLATSVGDVSNAELRSEIATLESELESLKEDRRLLEEKWSIAFRSLAEVTREVKEQQAKKDAAKQQLEALLAKKTEAEKQKRDTEKRLNDLKKSELEQDAEFWVYSPVVQLNVLKSPISVRLPRSVQIVQGKDAQIPLLIERRFGFDGQVLVKPVAASGAAVTAAPLVLGPGQHSAKLILQTTEQSNPGVWNAKLEFNLQFNKIAITDSMECSFEIVAKK